MVNAVEHKNLLISVGSFLLAGIQAAIVLFSIDDKEFALLLALILIIVTFALAAFFIYPGLIPTAVRKTIADITNRWNAPDLQKQSVFSRLYLLCGWAVVRWFHKIRVLPATWVAVTGIFIGSACSLLISNFLGGFTISQIGSVPTPYFVVGLAFFISLGAYFLYRQITRLLRRHDPRTSTIEQFITAFNRYKNGKNPAEIRRKIVIEDRGPVKIISIACRDLLATEGYSRNRESTSQENYDAFEAAWRTDPNKRFELLLCDPTCGAIRERNSRLNSRYLEYYALPYMELLFKSYGETKSGKNRIVMRRWEAEPDYRVVISKDRMIMQRYGRYKHGYLDPAVILYRVNFSEELENRLLAASCTENRHQVANSFCALKRSIVWNAERQEMHNEQRSLYSHFASIVEDLFDRADEETFITKWGFSRLRKFARYCHVDERTIQANYNAASVLARSICENLGLVERFDALNDSEETIQGRAKEENSPKAFAPEFEKSVRTIKIFLASSADLREDRDTFELYFRQQNDSLRKRGVYLKIVRWENFLDAMSETRLQDEYNKEVRDCDVFVTLFFTKTGKFTEEEFDTAHRQFRKTKKPLIYTFFKNAPVEMDRINEEIVSLLNFKKKLSELGHFHTVYDNTEHLKRQFKDQLDKLLEEGL